MSGSERRGWIGSRYYYTDWEIEGILILGTEDREVRMDIDLACKALGWVATHKQMADFLNKGGLGEYLKKKREARTNNGGY